MTVVYFTGWMEAVRACYQYYVLLSCCDWATVDAALLLLLLSGGSSTGSIVGWV